VGYRHWIRGGTWRFLRSSCSSKTDPDNSRWETPLQMADICLVPQIIQRQPLRLRKLGGYSKLNDIFENLHEASRPSRIPSRIHRADAFLTQVYASVGLKIRAAEIDCFRR